MEYVGVITKADIVEKIADELKVTKRDAQGMVESVFSMLKETLESGEDIKISGFGKFEITDTTLLSARHKS